jgi:hypothetical protein
LRLFVKGHHVCSLIKSLGIVELAQAKMAISTSESRLDKSPLANLAARRRITEKLFVETAGIVL